MQGAPCRAFSNSTGCNKKNLNARTTCCPDGPLPCTLCPFTTSQTTTTRPMANTTHALISRVSFITVNEQLPFSALSPNRPPSITLRLRLRPTMAKYGHATAQACPRLPSLASPARASTSSSTMPTIQGTAGRPMRAAAHVKLASRHAGRQAATAASRGAASRRCCRRCRRRPQPRRPAHCS